MPVLDEDTKRRQPGAGTEACEEFPIVLEGGGWLLGNVEGRVIEAYPDLSGHQELAAWDEKQGNRTCRSDEQPADKEAREAIQSYIRRCAYDRHCSSRAAVVARQGTLWRETMEGAGG